MPGHSVHGNPKRQPFIERGLPISRRLCREPARERRHMHTPGEKHSKDGFGVRKKVELTIMPRHIHMTVWQPNADDQFTSISSVKSGPISFSLNTTLSRLSWRVADEGLSLDETRKKTA